MQEMNLSFYTNNSKINLSLFRALTAEQIPMKGTEIESEPEIICLIETQKFTNNFF